jgi:YHS domain-containing protein
MTRLLLVFLLFFLVYTFFRAFARLLFPPRSPRSSGESPQGEEMVRDPQCGTYLPRTGALSRTVGGEKEYFCSEKCRDAFGGRK